MPRSIFSSFQVFKLQHARRVWKLSLRCEFIFFLFPSLSEVVTIPWGLPVLSGWVRRMQWTPWALHRSVWSVGRCCKGLHREGLTALKPWLNRDVYHSVVNSMFFSFFLRCCAPCGSTGKRLSPRAPCRRLGSWQEIVPEGNVAWKAGRRPKTESEGCMSAWNAGWRLVRGLHVGVECGRRLSLRVTCRRGTLAAGLCPVICWSLVQDNSMYPLFFPCYVGTHRFETGGFQGCGPVKVQIF